MSGSVDEFADKVVVVTGAAKGIGEATARLFHRAGASVALLDVDDQAAAVANSLESGAHYIHCDVADGRSVEAAFSTVTGDFGDVDVLVNNAGIQHYGTVTDTPEDEWDRVLAINLKSAYLCAKHAIPSMLRRGGGVVVNVASVQAFLSQRNVAPYTTSKTALLGLTRSIAVDYAPQIRCVAVCPGTVDTPMLRDAIRQSPDPQAVLDECVQMHPMNRIATPQEIAELILFVTSSKAGFMTGQPIRIDGGLGVSIGGSKRS
jgi:NAD(P)-dependent dehydrogenase (short-subunit alcohol dehydrogenase family)